MRTNLIVIAICAIIQTSYSQEDSRYRINRFGSAAFSEIATNPAFAGIEGRHILDLSYDVFGLGAWSIKQFKVDYSTTFGKKNRLGAGGYYFYDKLGFSAEHEFNASLAYKFNIKKKLDINLGLSAITYYRMVTDLEELRNGAADPDDPLLQGSKLIDDHLDYNTGLWLNYQKFYFGFSLLDFFTVDLNGDDTEFFNQSASTHIHTGYDFSLAKDWHICPAIYLVDIFEEYDRYHFGLFADYSNRVLAGITYKVDNSSIANYIGFRAGALIKKRIRAVAGYELAIDDRYNIGNNLNNWIFGLRLQY